MQKKRNSQNAKLLGISTADINDFGKVKSAYTKKIRLVTNIIEKRVQINIAYQQLCHQIFKSKKDHAIYYAVLEGKLEEVLKEIEKDKKLINYKSNGGYPLIYIAVRSGHYKIVQTILKFGCDLNFKQDKSTPMHCAAYYGHYTLISLLLQYGIPIHIKNKFNDLPIEESATLDIKEMLLKAEGNQILSLSEKLINEKYCLQLINIYQGTDIVIKKLIHKVYFNNFQLYDDAFHGTSINNFQLIAKYGMKKPGDIVQGKQLEIVQGHIKLGTAVDGISNWPKAIFASPSIYYAAHPVYSKEIITNSNQTWCPVVQLKIKKSSYTKHKHSLLQYVKADNQPTHVQYRVENDQNSNTQLIYREENMSNVIVVAFLFIKKGYLKDHPDYASTTELVLNSQDQKKYRKMHA